MTAYSHACYNSIRLACAIFRGEDKRVTKNASYDQGHSKPIKPISYHCLWVFNSRNDAFISEATRERIRTLAREMGYQPIEWRAATGRSYTISFAIDMVFHPLAAEVIHHVMREVDQDNYELIINRATHPSDDQAEAITEWPVDESCSSTLSRPGVDH